MHWLQKNRSNILYTSSPLIVVGALLWVMQWSFNRTAQSRAQLQATICPSLLSIGRSARDTLIIMRNEPLCTAYVLDNLK
jgi:hypothetical protein